ncbi:MAG TPA: rhomboid family intramembrane serine protease [Leptolyngbyaceae cyanobacterium]
MIPIADRVPSRSQPIVNYLLIGLNIALFLWEIRLEFTGELGNFVQNLGLIPVKISTPIASITTGNPAAIVAAIVFSGSLLSAMFLHASFSQILGNLIFLSVFGRRVEELLGHGRYLGFYLLGGIVTGILQVLVQPAQAIPVVGANNAIAFILGAYPVFFPKAKIDTILPLAIVFIPIQLPAMFYLVWWFLQQMFYGIGSLNIPGGVNSGGIAYLVQAVGLILGAFLVTLMKQKKERKGTKG